MVYDSIGQLIMSVSLMTGGAVFGILGLLFGFARGMTKDSDKWALIFSIFAWAFAFAIPSTAISGIIFVMGALAITMSYNSIIKKIPESNVFIIGIIAIFINFVLLVGVGGYNLTNQFAWENNLADAGSLISQQYTDNYILSDGLIPDSGLCRPGDDTCTNQAQSGTFESSVFDVFATYLAIPTYIGKAIKFAGAGLFAPVVITNQIMPKVGNTMIYYLVALYIMMWELVILYKTIIFILKRQSNM